MKKIQKIPLKEFNKIYSRVPRLCIEACIINSQGIILTKRNIRPAKGKWHFPGGTLMLKERLMDAVKRIAFRETGLKVEPKKILGIIEYPNFKGDIGHPISICFLAVIKGGTLQHDGDATDIRFFKKLPRPIIKEHADFISKNIKL
ncbi:MAG: NUDIX domain-containing protein [Patescibacteria group bacterium]|nr:NUDIX domain-containing protein [bacterium]MDZ4240502.1 NUDIX domain-containing protein [Patescibacteria group bacterium]